MQDLQGSEAQLSRRVVPSEQRVFSLVLALVASPQGLTKRDVLQVVYGYADRYQPDEIDSSLERQFERDKEQLRDLGIPVEAIDAPLEPGNNQLTRYRIDKRQLEMPADLRFSSRELSLLRLAALAWSEGSLTGESRRSVMKLEALGAGLDVQHVGIAPSIGMSSPVAPALQQAIAEGRSVAFEYQLPGREAPLGRRVAPLRLHRAENRWHLIAFDLEREADRVFLLSRIVGPVRIEGGGKGELPAELTQSVKDHTDNVVESLEALLLEQRANVVARRGSQAETRLTGRPSARTIEHMEGSIAGEGRGSDPELQTTTLQNIAKSTHIELGTLDYPELATELAGFGEQVAVLDPPHLRDDVVSRLRAVRDQHTVAPSQGANDGL